jgi:beta-phosphoglucomutase
MLRAIIFDFNGILVDDEPIHFDMFQKVLFEQGLSLTREEYYARYLGMDDRGCFQAAFRDRGRALDEATLAALIQRKAVYYRNEIQQRLTVFPGVKQLIPKLSASYPLAIASGALRSEIEMIMQTIGLIKYFQVIVSTEDITEGKPSPEIFTKALTLFNQHNADAKPIRPAECLVIEDSKEGILGARRAGMKCLAVTNSHPKTELTEADAVVESLDKVTIPFLQKLLD